MTFGKLLQENKGAIVQRWLEAALATYPGHAAAVFRQQKDPFANPIGHRLRAGTEGIFEALLDGFDADEVRSHLLGIVKVGAVQKFSASQTVGFIFHLKEAVRAELGTAVSDPKVSSELAELEKRIDQIALIAFDIFVQCREQICDLRVNEVKRRVEWIVDKMNQRSLDPELARINLE